MRKKPLPIYQIQDYNAQDQKEHYFYYSSFSLHLQEHLFIREPHKHDFYIILIVTHGIGTHTIDFKEYEVKPGTIFFMIPGQVHSWQLSDDADGYIIFFTQEFYAKAYPDRKLYSFPFFNTMLHRPVLNISPEDDALLMPVLQKIALEHKASGFMKEVMLSRLLDVLLIELTRLFRHIEHSTEVTGKDHSVLQKLERLIDQHYKEHMPVRFYADCLHVTTRHLNEICKWSLGKTTIELIHFRKVLETKRLLVHSDLTSSQVAAELGFTDNAYFFRFFKKHTGFTPEQFRAEK
ncbi:helix-turn-helix domain-containing protein [Pontibacter cellulosilyticus]|uniref:Helix-turn-helix domain-containing protein n=1 Tax=Pontibacter cellulosilyticus TaxID=1720253 RepID=A0A923N5M6_9BACT|nr:helix-turn-helix domain-containing protein [Pontibacter cellulosilyticus]MBC5992599.1 helix-turn-helix domain-containing protein [Pontibacter cellulosilyticus]